MKITIMHSCDICECTSTVIDNYNIWLLDTTLSHLHDEVSQGKEETEGSGRSHMNVPINEFLQYNIHHNDI
jgi:hypothetical protein